MKAWVLRQPFWSFYILAVLLSIFANAWMFGLVPNIGQVLNDAQEALGLNHFSVLVPLSLIFTMPLLLPSFLFPTAPAVSAIVISAIQGGGRAVKQLFGRFKPWRDGVSAGQAGKIYLVIFVGAFVVMAIKILWAYGAGGEEAYQAALTKLRFDTPLLFLGMFFMASIGDTGGLLEELGWRGYAFPLLQKTMRTPLHAALFLGVLWALWHFPRDVMPLLMGQPFSDFILGQLTYLPGPMALTVIIVYFFNRTGGSIIPAVLIHGISNYLGDTVQAGEIYIRFSPHTVIEILIAILIIMIAGPQLGRRNPESAKILR
jgi:membrane protease YdiL (CAAX protease family)